MITEYEQKISAINHAGGNNPSDAISSAFAQVSECGIIEKPHAGELSENSEKVQPMKIPHAAAAATPAPDTDVEMVEVVATGATNAGKMTEMVAVATKKVQEENKSMGSAGVSKSGSRKKQNVLAAAAANSGKSNSKSKPKSKT